MMGQLAALDDYDPNATFPPRFGDDAQSAAEAAAARLGRSVRRPSETSQETIDKLAGAASDVLIPKTPLDVGLTIATLPTGGLLGRALSPAVRTGAAALGAMFDPSEAKADMLGRVVNRIVRYPKGVPTVAEEPFHAFTSTRTGAKPVEEMSARMRDVPTFERPLVRPEDLLGKEIIFTQGDRTRAGGTLTHVGDTKLSRPVRMEGGPDYPFNMSGEQVWANAPSHSTQMWRLGQDVLERGRDPVLMYMAMGKEALDSSKQMALPAIDMVKQSGLSRDAVKTLNERMRAVDDSFPGWNSKNLETWAGDTSGSNRSALLGNLDQAWARKGGAPDLGELRFAMTDPRLQRTPTGSVGLTVSQFDPSRGVIPSMHSTYPTAVAGSASGTMGGSIPWHIAAPDVHDWLLKAGPPVKFAERPAYFQERKPKDISFPRTQVVDEQWVERVNNWIKENPGMWSAPPLAVMGGAAASDRYN